LSFPACLDKERYILLWYKQAIFYIRYGVVFLGLDQNLVILAQINDPPAWWTSSSHESNLKGLQSQGGMCVKHPDLLPREFGFAREPEVDFGGINPKKPNPEIANGPHIDSISIMYLLSNAP
jgi:hypothetical protein